MWVIQNSNILNNKSKQPYSRNQWFNFGVNLNTNCIQTNNNTDIKTIDWNFTDPTAVSDDINPTHVFSTPGNFNVKMNITSNCSNPYTVEKTVTVTQAPTISGVVTDATIADNDGEIDITITGGESPYDPILWQPGGQTTQDLTGLDGGNYSVEVVDANGCKQTANFTVQDIPCQSVFPILAPRPFLTQEP